MAAVRSMAPFLHVSQTLLRRLGLYNRVKASALYDLYWRIVDSRLIDEREAQLRFYGQLLQDIRSGDLVFDIGANQGEKVQLFLRLGLRVIAADPDEINIRVLREKFLLHRFRPKPVVVIPQAISDREGTETLWVNSPGSTMNTLSLKWVEMLRQDAARFGATLAFRQTKKISTTTLDHLIQRYGMPYYIKIDVEGFEPAVLRGLHRPVPYLSFEVNLPEFRPEGLECVRLLAAISNGGVFNYSADVSRGLVLPEWIAGDQFAEVLGQCAERTIEVFWRNRTV